MLTLDQIKRKLGIGEYNLKRYKKTNQSWIQMMDEQFRKLNIKGGVTMCGPTHMQVCTKKDEFGNLIYYYIGKDGMVYTYDPRGYHNSKQ